MKNEKKEKNEKITSKNKKELMSEKNKKNFSYTLNRDNFIKAMQRSGLSQVDIAEKLQVNKATVSNWKKEKNPQNISYSKLVLLAQVLDTNTAFLLGYDDIIDRGFINHLMAEIDIKDQCLIDMLSLGGIEIIKEKSEIVYTQNNEPVPLYEYYAIFKDNEKIKIPQPIFKLLQLQSFNAVKSIFESYKKSTIPLFHAEKLDKLGIDIYLGDM